MKKDHASQDVMNGLKDFQRRTVDFAFRRMFDAKQPARRFLVADEVGLGKTLIAKGLIAKTIEKLQREGQKRVDVVYVCSNADIAAQNVARLMQPGQPAFVGSKRLTLLPLMTERLNAHPVNFISFTPGTTFVQANRSGIKEERKLIYQMLAGFEGVNRKGLRRALQGSAGDAWYRTADEGLEYDNDIAAQFAERVREDRALATELIDLSSLYGDGRRRIDDEIAKRCLAMTGALRRNLAKSCLDALKPDLVILDEFQRFGELMEDPEDNPSAELAHALFNYDDDLRVLLLSATPYKMYATAEDSEDHYEEFIRTVSFLMPGEAERLEELKCDIREFRKGLLDISRQPNFAALSTIKNRIESTLKQAMCRTERVGRTARADAMVNEKMLVPRLDARDLQDFGTLDAIARTIEELDTIEYWKSSPYLLNFMHDYSLKRALRNDQGKRRSKLAEVLALGNGHTIASSDIDKYAKLDPGNARLRTMLDDIQAEGLHRLLWMPPSLPYWAPAGVYEKVGSVSKQVVFSSWNVVPDALAAMLSYEVERKIVHEAGVRVPDYGQLAKRFAPRLRLARQSDGRLTGMWNLMLMYPSNALVTLIDPLRLNAETGKVPQFAEMLRRAEARLAPHVDACVDRSVATGNEDRRWYWVALARLEAALAPDNRGWCADHWRQGGVKGVADEHDDLAPDTVFKAHVKQWLDAWDELPADLGRVPVDLTRMLAMLALGGPATCALRSLSRQEKLSSSPNDALLSAAARIAEGFRSQFNSPRAIALLQGNEDDDSYWRKVLHYATDGNMQALIDEYVHVLCESKGKERSSLSEVEDLAESMAAAMTMRSSSLRPDELKVVDGQLKIMQFQTAIRCHFAVRFGGKVDEEAEVSRKRSVQAAFNSPFWPFVLVTTSVGQEGLDFHPWCHAVTHWNLPSNPVDMEQREGRVHRYKGYAVRKNIARKFGAALWERVDHAEQDPWDKLFALARVDRPRHANDLVPYWIYEVDGGACIERRVMALPLSRDEVRYRRLKRSLALYRMVFAQPRQEDLLACLEQSLGEDQAAEAAAQWKIDLEPTD